MMREKKFRVWCEFEIDGKIETSMESPASWFLLTQTGKLWEYGPTTSPQPLSKRYRKAIPLFYVGREDRDGKEMYEGDIIALQFRDKEPTNIVIRNFIEDTFHLIDELGYGDTNCKVVGNIYENPELLSK